MALFPFACVVFTSLGTGRYGSTSGRFFLFAEYDVKSAKTLLDDILFMSALPRLLGSRFEDPDSRGANLAFKAGGVAD